MHLAIIGGFVKKLFKPFLGYNTATFITLLACGFFLWFAGVSPSLLRAFICLFISTIFEFLGINIKNITILSLSFLIQIALFPEHCLSLSFMLSYTGLAGIYLFMEFIKWIYTGYLRLPKKLAESIAVSTAAQAGILPVSIFCLKQIVPAGIITTLCVSLFISLFFILGIFGIIFSVVFNGSSAVFSFLLSMIYAIICKIIDFFTLFPPINL
jgi:competence protein ComEC